jgi:mono/diheme cytochrome c family protein
MGARRLVVFVFFGSVVALAAAIGAAPQQDGGNAEAAKIKNPVPANADSIAAGETLYRRRCAGCHGVDGKGGPPKDAGDPAAANLVDDKWDHGGSDGEIFTTIREGIGPSFRMEPFNDRLSEPDTWNIVNYIRSLAKK